MNNYFETILNNAILKCEGNYIKDDNLRNGFSKIYPFTTENISGYIDEFNLEEKSLLTVGSSGDQVINSTFLKCKDQTVIDICPYTKFYFYLKKSALLTLTYEEYIIFFCYRNFGPYLKNNDNVFYKKYYLKLRDTLRLLNYESYLFWEELFCLYNPKDVRVNLFDYDEYSISVLKNMNLYLRNEDSYNQTKKLIKNVNPTFITDDIFKIEFNKTFDNIFLSNIGIYNELDEMKNLFDKLNNNLNVNGKMLLCYLYKTKINTKYDSSYYPIYNLDLVFQKFENYITIFKSFIGTTGLIHDIDSIKDSVLIYQKTK